MPFPSLPDLPQYTGMQLSFQVPACMPGRSLFTLPCLPGEGGAPPKAINIVFIYPHTRFFSGFSTFGDNLCINIFLDIFSLPLYIMVYL